MHAFPAPPPATAAVARANRLAKGLPSTSMMAVARRQPPTFSAVHLRWVRLRSSQVKGPTGHEASGPVCPHRH